MSEKPFILDFDND
ncbi:Protein of unknown function [Lactobacillus helveticus CIRM-BIA 104]|nr:Protein of unknown function [Lactobacillus helveticus CIRM-BIA 104]